MLTLTERCCGACGQSLPEPLRLWAFWVPLEPPSQNVVSSNKGSGRHRYRRYRDQYTLLLKNEQRLHRIPTAIRRRRVFIERVYCGRGQSRDRGNLVGGCKPLLDAMHLVGMLVDDGPNWVEDHYSQARGDDAGALIQIEELPP